MGIPGYQCEINDQTGQPEPPGDLDIQAVIETEINIHDAIVTCSSYTSGTGVGDAGGGHISPDGSNIIGVDYSANLIFNSGFQSLSANSDITLIEVAGVHSEQFEIEPGDHAAGIITDTGFCVGIDDPSCGYTMRRNVGGCWAGGLNSACSKGIQGEGWGGNDVGDRVQFGFAFRNCETCDFTVPCWDDSGESRYTTMFV